MPRTLKIPLTAVLMTAFLTVSTAGSGSVPQITDAQLRHVIVKESPGLRAALDAHDNYKAATIILRWAAPRIPFARTEPPFVTADKEATQIYEAFESLKGGVNCGGASDYFVKLLALFNIPSYALDFGSYALDTHVTVAVPLDSAQTRFALLGPTFAFLFTDRRTGRVATFEELLDLWLKHDLGRVRIDQIDMSARPRVDGVQNKHSPPATACGDSNTPSAACGDLDSMFARHGGLAAEGMESGLSGMLQLFVTGQVFSYMDPPQAILDLHNQVRSLTPVDRFPPAVRPVHPHIRVPA